MMPPDPSAQRAAFVVHGLDQARAACAAAAGAGRPIALVSAPHCAQFAGVGWFQALVDQARAEYPLVDIIAILQCGDAAGRAMQAMAHGVRHLVVDPRCPALPRLRDLAAARGATLLTEPPDAVDLATVADVDAACRAALAAPAQD